MNGHLRLGLGIIVQGDAFRARKRGDQDLDLVLLDQLLCSAQRRIRTRVRRACDDFELLAPCLVVVLHDRELEAPHAVLAECGVCPF